MQRVVAAVLLVVSAGVVTLDPPTASAEPLGNVRLNVMSLFDSRTNVPGGRMVSGTEYPAPAPSGTIGNGVIAAQSDSGAIYLHPCGVTVDPSQPAAWYAQAGQTTTNLVEFGASMNCMTALGDVAVFVLVRVAERTSEPGLGYVEHDEWVELFVADSAGGGFEVQSRDATVPANAEAVVLLVEAIGDDRPTYGSAGGCPNGGEYATVVVSPYGAADNLAIVPIDPSGRICLATSPDAPVLLTVTRLGYLAPDVDVASQLPLRGYVEVRPPGFVPLAPARLFDTRDSNAPIAAGGVYRHQFTGLPEDATAVALNITATETTAAGYVTAYPCDSAERPEVSNVNFTGPGQIVPNYAIVTLGVDQDVCFYALARTHLLVDFAGYFGAGGSGYEPLIPERLFDTRDTGQRLRAGSTFTFDLSAYVSPDATAAVMNVTATDTRAAGYITVFPCGTNPPKASNVNYFAGQTRPNAVSVKLPPDKKVCFFTLAATHLLADLAGSYAGSSEVGFVALEPYRLFDTRELDGGLPLEPNDVWFEPTFDPTIEALAWNLTVTQTGGPGYVTAYPCSLGEAPEVSNVNYVAPGQTVANFAFVTPDDAGDVCLFTLERTHLIADEAGFFSGPYPIEVAYP